MSPTHSNSVLPIEPDGQTSNSPATLALYDRLVASSSIEEKLAVTAGLLLSIFDDFYSELRAYPWRAKASFEAMDTVALIEISKRRLGLYSHYVSVHGPAIKSHFPELSDNFELWEKLEKLFESLIVVRYEADIAFAFVHSIKRHICHVIWRPVAYSFPRDARDRGLSSAKAQQRFVVNNNINEQVFVSALQLPRFKVAYRDMYLDAKLVADRLSELLALQQLDIDDIAAIEFVEGAFFRDQTAFLVGRMESDNGNKCPLALALLNSENGVYVDAVLYKTADVHNLFSSTLANFHVTNNLYYQVCVFLASTMPLRPIGLHYSTIGFNHVGKVAILDEVKAQLEKSQAGFSSSPGFEGTVAIGFTFPHCSYHLKVIRDTPTRSYKWGEFAGVDSVLGKYRQVHEINRTGSMVDNVIYFNLELDSSMFTPELLDDLLENASGSVQLMGSKVLFRSLIVQLKIIPLPIYFEQAGESELESVILNLGHCIRNNVAANIFNKDLDARNYGVGRYGKVFLFDYDAVERFTEIQLSTNLDLEDGEEDIPDWFFSDQFVFLPEELESGLQIQDRNIRRMFRELNADLLSLEYWQAAQDTLRQGGVLELKSYPDERRLGVDTQSSGEPATHTYNQVDIDNFELFDP